MIDEKGSYLPRRVFISEDSLKYDMTERILARLPEIPQEIILDEREFLEAWAMKRDPIGEGKGVLFLTRQRGGFVKPCPCTPIYIGCRYYILNTDTNCPLDCSYCILQAYLSNPLVTVHVNTDDLWRDLDFFLGQNPRILRLGTGELGDSLALDHLSQRSRELISYFRERPSVLFELKTKTIQVENVLSEKPAENIVIAWSLNAPSIAAAEEGGAPPVVERIEAARMVSRRGYPVAFHFDPLIRFPGWEEGYAEVISKLMERVDRRKIAWISLGALRFAPALKPVIQKRFPDSPIIYDELIKGRDGKFRYFKPLRMELFQKIGALLKREGGEGLRVYFCMEDEDVWWDVLRKKTRGEEDTERYLTSPRV